MYDVVIIGGGPAGLSAALVLGRCRRSVLICDEGKPRNRWSEHLHGYLTRDGTPPGDLLRLGRDELKRYPSVQFSDETVVAAECISKGFSVTLNSGGSATARKMLLCTGVVDRLPKLEGFEQAYGRSIFHCPYCDGWENRDKKIVVYANGSAAFALTLKLLQWSRDMTIAANGPADFSPEQLEVLHGLNVALEERPVKGLHVTGGELRGLFLDDGELLACEAMFFSLGVSQASLFAKSLGCTFTPAGGIDTSERNCTTIPGIYAAGDALREVQLAIVAAAEGAIAATAINKALSEEDLQIKLP